MNLKSLLKPALAIGSIAAAPFTAGTSLSWLPAAIGAGGVLANAKGGQQKPGVSSKWGADQWLGVGQLAAGTFGNIYGANKAQSGNRAALAAQMAGQTQAEILAREQMAEEKRMFELTRQEQAAQWAAAQKFESDKFAASEEERLYARRLKDEQEARRSPYREASAAALGRLPGLIASGRQTPGMGSLKWMAGK